MLGHLWIGAHDEQAPLGDVGQRRPHLLAVDDPLVAVLHAARRQAREVGPRARLAEELAPDLLAGEQRPQARLLRLGPPLHDGRAAHAVADRVAEERVGPAGGEDPLVDDPLQLGVQAETAVALGEVNPGQAPVELGAQEGHGVGGLRREVAEELVDEADDAILVGADRAVGENGHRA